MSRFTVFLLVLGNLAILSAQAVYNGSNKHTFTTNHGTIEIGPMNSSWGHIYTDRPKIIFNKDVYTITNAFSSYNNDLIFKTEGNERMRINDDTGNVGIGTTNPVSKLQVNGDFFLYSNDAYPSGWGKTYFNWRRHSLIMGTPVGTYAHNKIELKPGGSNTGELISMMEFYQALGENNQEMRIRISSSTNHPTFFNSGNVGIGTTSPDAKLAVKGQIHAQEVKVDLNGAVAPDYVFDMDYDLKSLEEVQEYIRKNGHLPNIPSAAEMEKEGLHLKDMNLKLLEKIEELTLYTLQQQRRIEILENTIQKLLR